MNVQQWLNEYKTAYDDLRKTISGKDGGKAGSKWAQIYGDTASQLVTNQMQADAQRKESELAYQRSKPVQQVQNMTAAGMSRAGAINALNGGGSYTPATITPSAPTPGSDALNASQALIGNMFTGSELFANLAQIDMQRQQLKEQKRQFNMQHAEQKRQFDISSAETKRVNNATISKLGIDTKIAELEHEVLNATKDGRINRETAENLAGHSQAILDDFRSKRVFAAMARMTDEELDNLFELQATLNMLQQGLQYDSTGVVLRAVKKLGSFIGGSKVIGKNIRTH